VSRGLLVAVSLLLATAGARAADETGIAIRWLGVAGFSIESDGTVLLHDPYLSRPGMLRTLLRQYEPDASVLERLLAPGGPVPELDRARLLLIGHSHFDHLGDAAWLARSTEATVAGSPTTVAIARGYGLATRRAREVAPGQSFAEGPFDVSVVASRHAPVLFGRVPLPGEVTAPPARLLHAFSFKMGGAFGYLLTHRPSGRSLYLLSSAAVDPDALEALGAEAAPVDALLVATTGRDEGYARALVTHLRPRLVVPHHFDDFFRALDRPDAGEPRDPEDLDRFEEEVRAAAREVGIAVELRRPALFERWVLPAAP